MNKVITIGRQFGSGGRELGLLLARELGIAYYDKQIISEIVDHTDFSENYVKEVMENRFTYVLPTTYGLGTSIGNENHIMQMQKIVKAQTDVIREMATKSSCVIVGRCADYILKDNKDIDLIRLFVYADMESRVKRCMERAPEGENFTEKEMQKQIKKVDKNRANYYEDFTLQSWGGKEYYDVCVNTSRITPEKLAPYIAGLFK